jgi:hypothetical protein
MLIIRKIYASLKQHEVFPSFFGKKRSRNLNQK